MNTVVNDDSIHWIKDNWGMRTSNGKSISFLRLPFDHCVSYRPGTRLAPNYILNMLGNNSLYCVDRRTDLSGLNLIDQGEIHASNRIHDYYKKVRKAVCNLPTDSILMAVGGDHSVSDPIVRGQIDRFGEKIGLIVIDAHFDSRPPVKGKEHSGHWIYTLKDSLNYESTAQLGINATIYAQHYMDVAEKSGIFIRTMSEIRQVGVKETIEEAINHVTKHSSKFHLSIDIDAIDQAYCPGTSVPNPCGLFPHDVIDMAFIAASHKGFIGADLMEVSPPLDIENKTCNVAVQIIINLMAGLAKTYC